MTLGSLFDGSGGFPLAGIISGITPVWTSEILPFAALVSGTRLPGIKQYGDIKNLCGAEIEPVDIITFGSPCQDFSTLGNKGGLKCNKKSYLFYEAVRIIKEMRAATKNEYPKYIVWENVQGSLTSSKGEDFYEVLKQSCSIVSSRDAGTIPKSDKWRDKGEILGDNYSFAWKLFQSEGFGAVSRRTRVYLVGDLNGRSAGEILFTANVVPTEVYNCLRTVENSAVPQSVANEVAGTITKPDNYHYKKKIDRNVTIPVLSYSGFKCILFSENILPTLPSRNHNRICVAIPDGENYKFRYLLPDEYASAMGFPAWWCSNLEVINPSQKMVDYYKSLFSACGKEKTDEQVKQFLASPFLDIREYTLWGNGIILANAKTILSSIVDHNETLEKE